MASNRPYRGAFPVAPTIFDDRGSCIDFMIDAGSQGICILANFSPAALRQTADRAARADPGRELPLRFAGA
jgi:4-hydroxy-tetrahydrodipicolinate synthase